MDRLFNMIVNRMMRYFLRTGINTGIDLDKLIAAGQRICTVLGRSNGSRVAHARVCA